MLTGRVTPNGLPVVPVSVGGQVFEAILDTGFEGAIQLPSVLLPGINALYVGKQKYALGDGDEADLDVYAVEIDFDATHARVLATLSDHDEILIGTDLLRSYRLTIDFPAGTVCLDRPPPP